MKLNEVYSDQAYHFYHTRKKHWPEMDSFLNIVKNLPQNCRWIDLGCGAWRVVLWLHNLWRADIQYIGVDNARGFIFLAKDLYPTKNFVQDDMLEFVSKQNQQNVQCISAIASIQHLDSTTKRQLFFDLSYRALEYNWYLILTNRTFSKRFILKYWHEILFSLRNNLISLWKYKRNDLSIPRKDPQRRKNNKIFERYYHIFLLDELKSHALKAWFSIEKICYMSQEGKETKNRFYARNSILICKKSLI